MIPDNAPTGAGSFEGAVVEKVDQIRAKGFAAGPTTLNPDGTCGGDSPYWRWEPLTFSSVGEADDG